jgi:hypothetical protein
MLILSSRVSPQITFLTEVIKLYPGYFFNIVSSFCKAFLLASPGVFLRNYTGCFMKNLWCCNFLIFHTILINDVSNKIVLNGLQFELIQYLFLSSVFGR